MTWEKRIEVAAAVFVGAAAFLVLGAVLGAFAASAPAGVNATTRFEFLARAAAPVPAALALVGVLALIRNRSASSVERLALGTAAFISVAMFLLAVNGVLLDLTSGNASLLTRLSRIVFLRIPPLAIAAVTVWFSLATAPARPESPRDPTS